MVLMNVQWLATGLVENDEFLVLPHESVKHYMASKVLNYEKWLEDMRGFRRKLMFGMKK